MPDIIHLLPDSVANQIAAGEVIQRPASAVKELMENAVDAGAATIRLIVKDAGRTLIQVVDDGKGMSETDARIAFERHATSKIKSAEDLFNLHTMGFRGEALASIAAVAQVEMKTKREEDVAGTQLLIEGSTFVSQEPCAIPTGTSFSIKNLFYNVPARRNFLKSDAAEFRHIMEEFERIAFAHPDISFSLTHNGNELFHVQKGNSADRRAAFRQRIVALYGNPYNERLVPVEEQTDIVAITGYVIKPEFSKKSRGEQFFFLNKRFIKNNYLHHAIQLAFEQLLPRDTYPSYFLFLEVDPHFIDVNIHPTKTEVKFQDERSVYAILRSAVKRALGQYSIAPSLDFESEMSMEIPQDKNTPVKMPEVNINRGYNPFSGEQSLPETGTIREKRNAENWQEMFAAHVAKSKTEDSRILHSDVEKEEIISSPLILQLHERYIVATVKSGVLVIDQQRAHERVLYERYLRSLENQNAASQQLLFPETIRLSPTDAETLSSLLTEVNNLGFDVRPFGSNTFVVQGVPTGTENLNCTELLEKLLDTFVQNRQQLHLQVKENIARSLAKQAAIRPGRQLSQEEMRALIDELFAGGMPEYAPDGKPAFIRVGMDELDRRFKR